MKPIDFWLDQVLGEYRVIIVPKHVEVVYKAKPLRIPKGVRLMAERPQLTHSLLGKTSEEVWNNLRAMTRGRKKKK